MTALKRLLLFGRILFLFLVLSSLYLLVLSRAGEVHTVWEFMNPLFVPMFFVTTLVLVVIVFSSEVVGFKLVFVMLYSFVARSFFAVVFPAGSLGSQQSVLGITRLIYENVVFHGWGGDVGSIPLRAFHVVDRPNFQSAYSVVFARMFGVDVFWVHMFFVAVLWAVFVPLLAFLIARSLSLNDRVSVLAGLLASAFPLLVFWGTSSVPMSLGYLFFLGLLYFCLKYLKSGESKVVRWMVVFAFASFLSHFMSGVVSFGFLVLALSLHRYKVDEARIGSSLAARGLLFVSFVFAVVVLPLALNYLFLVYPVDVYFSLGKLEGLPFLEVLGLFLVGQFVYYDFSTVLIQGVAPLVGLVGLAYALYASRRGKSFLNERVLVLFLFLGFLVVLVDYRVLKLFALGLPVSEERVWVFRDFVVFPFAAFLVCAVVEFLGKSISGVGVKSFRISSRGLLRVVLSVFVFVLIAGWVLASVFSVYPHFGPLQITSYELDAARHLKDVSDRSYVVIGDRYTDLAGGMIVGLNNPGAFYFAYTDPFGIKLFNEMVANPSNETMVKAMDFTNCTIGYFFVDRLRLGDSEFDRVVSAALLNGLERLPVGFGDGMLVVFRFEKIE